MVIDTPRRARGKPKAGEPIWEMAHFFPCQGDWTEEGYLALETNHFVEFDNGYLEFRPMPTKTHQRIVLFLYRLLWAFIETHHLDSELLTAPLPVRLWPQKYREPDLIYLSPTHPARHEGKYPSGADLVVEVVSGSGQDRQRDLVTKREEYAAAGIPEYWIVDPQEEQIIVLTLAGKTYQEHGIFTPGQEATSVLLAGFSVAVTAVFAAAHA